MDVGFPIGVLKNAGNQYSILLSLATTFCLEPISMSAYTGLD